ncbi:CLK4-associating serine/arginine rich protein isoform X3 [Lingula anatina]|uniref:CLK4-associating serine/arginine rich protein isoform X3 n=1 Tax=Lingula anatina TaxID=7574 RepID=A0A1S3IVC7_LINAN|nr:CLK4-associating serine/arginine rich protein isoform X3 [Lingula anatina]|eukprot:XP_013401911.1 CLK4-associating serine/arginine rich protein isoform X3 [Lingula anatina]
MWHEARKQEKKIRGLMVDYRKRAERRREYYEKIKADPTIFLRVYGRPVKIHLEPAVAYAAESPQSMMPWQGDQNNLIDRFDVRAHLDIIPHVIREESPEPSIPEDEEERSCNYERYRTMVQNECSGLTEEQCLQQIAIEEQFYDVQITQQRKGLTEEEKKSNPKKAAIGYTYEDAPPPPEEEENSDQESDISVDPEDQDLDIALDVNSLTPDQIQLLNKCAATYGMQTDDFIEMLMKDKDEEEELKMAKLLEEEKAQFSGRKSRRERRAFKEKKLKDRKFSPPSYAARKSPTYEAMRSSSSRSRSRSPDASPKMTFITSFGGGSSDEETGPKVQGPSLPPLLTSESRGPSWPDKPRLKKSTSKSPTKSRRIRSDSRSRSRSRFTSSSRSSKSRSRSRSRKSSRSRSSRSRSRSSRSSRSRSKSRYHRSRSRSRSRRKRASSSRSRSRSSSPTKKKVQKPVIKSYRRPSLSSNDSIGSDTEKEEKSEKDDKGYKKRLEPIIGDGKSAAASKVISDKPYPTRKVEKEDAGSFKQTIQSRQKS